MRAAEVEIWRVTCPSEAPAAYARLRATAEGSVGVDCEGTDPEVGGPGPLMVQVASSRVVVVETPGGARAGSGYSDELRAILADPLLTKVFCVAKDDVRALRGTVPPMEIIPEVVDVRDLTSLPDTPTPGLAAVLSYADLGVSWFHILPQFLLRQFP